MDICVVRASCLSMCVYIDIYVCVCIVYMYICVSRKVIWTVSGKP